LYAGDGGENQACSNATLQGDYGFSISGSRPTGPGGPVEQILGVAMTHFDGAGNLTQTDNIKGSISGFTQPDRPGTGGYSVNEDCTGTMTLTNHGAPTLTLRIVVVDQGKEIRTVVVSPATVMVTSNGKRA
jgi:hypothetical protein